MLYRGYFKIIGGLRVEVIGIIVVAWCLSGEGVIRPGVGVVLLLGLVGLGI